MARTVSVGDASSFAIDSEFERADDGRVLMLQHRLSVCGRTFGNESICDLADGYVADMRGARSLVLARRVPTPGDERLSPLDFAAKCYERVYVQHDFDPGNFDFELTRSYSRWMPWFGTPAFDGAGFVGLALASAGEVSIVGTSILVDSDGYPLGLERHGARVFTSRDAIVGAMDSWIRSAASLMDEL